MQIISTTNARKQLAELIDTVKETGEPIAIGRRNRAEVIVTKAPKVVYNPDVSEITNLNAMGGAFDFLEDEPDLYTLDDAQEVYV